MAELSDEEQWKLRKAWIAESLDTLSATFVWIIIPNYSSGLPIQRHSFKDYERVLEEAAALEHAIVQIEGLDGTYKTGEVSTSDIGSVTRGELLLTNVGELIVAYCERQAAKKRTLLNPPSETSVEVSVDLI